MREEITADNKEIQSIVRKYYEQQYANKLDNLDEMDKFLQTFVQSSKTKSRRFRESEYTD